MENNLRNAWQSMVQRLRGRRRARAAAPMAGTKVGPYRIVRLLGAGGMGTVYLAEHETLHSTAAIKVLHPEHASDAEMVQRFFNEARATAAIHHPNIVNVLDCGRLAGGAAYIVMEHLKGESLAARLEHQRRLPVAEALDIAVQAARGLAAAHDIGIVHRDLKPDNLFLATQPHGSGAPLVKVLDFGVAKLNNLLNAAPSHTRPGMLIGTPGYMAPEQFAAAQEVDGRADVYALGTILYQMLCGVAPFAGSDNLGTLIYQHLHGVVTPPRVHAPGLAEHLEAAVMRALAKSPGDRFAGMRELSDALGAPGRRGGRTFYGVGSDNDPHAPPPALLPRLPTSITQAESVNGESLAVRRSAHPGRRRFLVTGLLPLVLVGAIGLGGLRWRVRAPGITSAASVASPESAGPRVTPSPPQGAQPTPAALTSTAWPRGPRGDVGTAAQAFGDIPVAPATPKHAAKKALKRARLHKTAAVDGSGPARQPQILDIKLER